MNEQQSANRSTDIFSVLKKRIVAWEYAPGHRLTEEGLSEEFGISRSPVREALRMLVENGLVDKEPHKGYTVKQLDLQEVHELYDVRMALEIFVIVRLAQGQYSCEGFDDLYNTWKRLKDTTLTSTEDFAKLDEQFHEKLAHWTGNRTLLEQIRSINERLYFIRVTDITTTERLQETCRQHLKILDCIKESNVDCAREALQLNIEDGRKNVEHAIKEALARAYFGPRTGAS